MAFDKEAEENELEHHIELIFKADRPKSPTDLTLGPSAYIAMGRVCSDQRGRPMITTQEMSLGALKGQVDYIKACLDACLAEAKARFAAEDIDV
jgi:hypothetical protein